MGRISQALYIFMLVSLVLIFCVAGCGNKSVAGSTALLTGQNFAAALDKGDFAAAAEAFDYDTQARDQNENWDDIPDGQRKLITDSMIKDRAAELVEWPAALGMPVTVEEGEAGSVLLKGSVSVCTLKMIDKDGKWFVGEVWW